MRTLSVIKADVGSNAGHLRPTDGVVGAVEDTLEDEGDILDDYFLFTVGDDIDILMSHTEGENADAIHRLAWDAFEAGTAVS
jgi:fructose 1,6-bisphosphate aldolase/phosphatase